MALATTPTITSTVNQSFFIEALGGAQNPVSYLDRFPDSVYTKAVDSLLVRFMYALLGPTGVGALKQEYLEARLQVEEAGLQTADIDSLYTNAFAFARLADETYEVDASADLLPAAQRSQILTQDAAFRNRAIDFLKGARAGGTLTGITLVARSGLNRPVEVIENYRALYDRYADLPLGLVTMGVTSSPHEVVVVPRQVDPQSSVQTLSIVGAPTTGWFTLSYPGSQNWMAIPVTTTSGSTTITVPNAAQIPTNAFVTLTSIAPATGHLDPTVAGWNFATLYTQSQGGAGTSLTLSNPAPTTGTFVALVGQGQTVPIPYNATAAQVQNALIGLLSIGNGNILCSGGPLPSQAIQIQFAGKLSDQSVPFLAANLQPDRAVGVTVTGSGGTEEMSSVAGTVISAEITMATVGISADQQATTIAPADEYAMLLALNQTKPMTTVITTQDGQSTTVRQQINSSFTASSRVEVVRYATGRASVTWPMVDSTHWIEGGVEHEAPKPLGSGSQHYQGFHNIANILAYTELALADVNYASSSAGLLAPYWDSNIGGFSNAQQTLVPGLTVFVDPDAQYLPINAVNSLPEPLIISNAGVQSVINGIYPVDYYSLPGVRQPTKTTMWASSERPSGTDYLEIDLGAVQAVNYLYFEAARVPYLIDVAYDVLDQAPARQFKAVTLANSPQSVTTLAYENTVTNMWETVEIFFNNSLGGMLYTRFLRIGFTRSPSGTPFQPLGEAATPYSMEVRNLRVGRNVSTPDAGIVRFVST